MDDGLAAVDARDRTYGRLVELLYRAVKDALLHRFGVVHPGGVLPRMVVGDYVSSTSDGILIACSECDWRSANCPGLEGTGTPVQWLLDNASAEAVRSGRLEQELIVLEVLTS